VNGFLIYKRHKVGLGDRYLPFPYYQPKCAFLFGEEKMAKVINLIGQKFGRLKVIRQSGFDKWGHSLWQCKCDCGIEKVINQQCLRNGITKSCGCLRREISGDRKRLSPGLGSMRTIILSYKRNAKMREIEYKLTEEQFREITQRNCYYCGAKPNNTTKYKQYFGDYIYNGIDRIDNNRGYIIDNVVPCCHTCNQSKSSLTIQEFQDWIEKVYQNKQNWEKYQ